MGAVFHLVNTDYHGGTAENLVLQDSMAKTLFEDSKALEPSIDTFMLGSYTCFEFSNVWCKEILSATRVDLVCNAFLAIWNPLHEFFSFVDCFICSGIRQERPLNHTT